MEIFVFCDSYFSFHHNPLLREAKGDNSPSLARVSQVALVVKNLLANAEAVRDAGLTCGWGRSPGGGNGDPLKYLPGESHGQRSLAGYSPWGHRVRPN